MQTDFVTVAEAARLLAIQPSTIRGWILRREVPFIRIGKKTIRIERSTIDGIIERGRVHAGD
jgi:excisionase family DNA binding protein